MRPVLRRPGIAPSIGGAALLILGAFAIAGGIGLLIMVVAKAVTP